MAVLKKELQDQIDELINLGNEIWENDKPSYFDHLLQAWDLYPIPKNNWNEAYSLAKELFDAYIIEEDYVNAQNWLNEMISHNNNLHLFDFDLEHNEAKYHFETGNYQTALDKWKYVVKNAGKRYFENEKPEYLEFYKNPEKYIK
ncbi:hypothetical protein J2X31_002185 [Flavobacterium arsenatis]|uniref:Tetratricopeptide repeat protein n=1 Tax=Flavobacterium arsenatis TaxID=1484332 RepID=A0ABU1TQA5_9FLAO|nr:hypothetical protein [Flavobacterium arsenatis]MDR6968170.1 hypothetical protein [Flavobacterium arsenatis]